MSEDFREYFAVTHFFNPPRYMRLLELVAGSDTRAGVITALRDFGDRLLGKSVVDCKDTPGCIANRIGILWMGVAVRFAFEDGITVEEADAIIGKPMGIPKTGIFGLLDLVGAELDDALLLLRRAVGRVALVNERSGRRDSVLAY